MEKSDSDVIISEIYQAHTKSRLSINNKSTHVNLRMNNLKVVLEFRASDKQLIISKLIATE